MTLRTRLALVLVALVLAAARRGSASSCSTPCPGRRPTVPTPW